MAATITNLLFTNATGTNATTTNLATSYFNASGYSYISNLFGTLATFSAATTTNIFAQNLFNNNLTSTGTFALATGTISSSSILYANIDNLFANNTIGTLATYTSGTSTNWLTTNSSSTNASVANLVATNATFSYATVTNGFFTNLSVSGPLAASLTNGLTFRGNSANISEATTTIFVANSGKVGIGGTTTPAEVLSVQGNLLVSGNILNPKLSSVPNSADGGDVYLCISTGGVVVIDCSGNYSDERLKKNLATVTSVLEKVKSLNTVNFNWIDENRGTSTQIGYVAQDVEKVFPEAIKHDQNGFMKVKYDILSAIYANAIKELDKLVFDKITEILNRVGKNEEDILNLRTRMEKVESTLQMQIPVAPVEVPVLEN